MYVNLDNRRIAVIGGGLAGLASACTLAARGYSVTVFEKSAWLGGKAAQLSKSGFRFDMGPTILTIPNVLRKIFAEAGRNLDDYLQLIRLDPAVRQKQQLQVRRLSQVLQAGSDDGTAM